LKGKKMKKVLIGIGIVLCVFVFSGCLEQFWPAAQPSLTTVKYANEDPAKYGLPITTIGNIKKLETKIAETHLEKQLRLQSELDIDSGVHSLVKAETEIIRTEAQQQYQKVIGTLDSPGVLWTVLTALGGSGLTATVLRKIWYTEEEHQAEVAKAAETKTTATS
jgi:hypothetical protein